MMGTLEQWCFQLRDNELLAIATQADKELSKFGEMATQLRNSCKRASNYVSKNAN